MRLTLFYAGLFLLLGTVLLAIVYVLASRGGSISCRRARPGHTPRAEAAGRGRHDRARPAGRGRTSSPSSTTPTSTAC